MDDDELFTAWLRYADGSGSMSIARPSMFSAVQEVHEVVERMAEHGVTFKEIRIVPGDPFSEEK